MDGSLKIDKTNKTEFELEFKGLRYQKQR